MNQWPGTPKSQQSPPINRPSTRFPFTLNENSTIGEVVDKLKTAFDGLTVHEQAFAALPAQLASQATAAATQAVTEIISQETVTGVTSFNSQTGAVIYFPNLGTVNNILGDSSYTTQPSDAGRKIICGDSSNVYVTLNRGVGVPWFTIIGNDSASNVFITASSGAGFHGLNELYPGGVALVFYDGSTFWSEGYPGGLSATIITAKLTGGGSNGSMTFVNGSLVSQVAAT